MKNTKKILIWISLALLTIIVACYFIPQMLVNWLVNRRYENVFLEECTAQDEQLLPNTELLISACKSPIVRSVPGGEVLFVYERKTDEIYLLDLHSGDKKQLPNDPLLLEKGIFFSSELAWLEGSGGNPSDASYRPHYILDLNDGTRYELFDLHRQTSSNILDNGKFNSDLSFYFTEAEDVFIYYRTNHLIAISSNFQEHPERNIIVHQSQLGNERPWVDNVELLKKLMENLRVNYEIINSFLLYDDVLSPSGKYAARYNGIYLTGTDVPVVGDEYLGGSIMADGFRSWYYDESGVVFKQLDYQYVGDELIGFDFVLPRPVLKLNISIP